VYSQKFSAVTVKFYIDFQQKHIKTYDYNAKTAEVTPTVFAKQNHMLNIFMPKFVKADQSAL